jgi:hypothetical protein
MLSIATALLLMFTMRGNAAEPRFAYLSKAANEITAIDHDSLTLSKEASGKIAKIACAALSQLVNDPEFEQGMRAVLKQDVKAAMQLLDNLRAFNEEFLRTEQKNLEAAGLDFPTSIDALAISARQRKQVSMKELSVTKTIADVTRLRDAACKLQQQLVVEQQARLIRLGILGVGVVVADIGVAVATSGGTAAIALTSVALGSTIIYDTANALTK